MVSAVLCAPFCRSFTAMTVGRAHTLTLPRKTFSLRIIPRPDLISARSQANETAPPTPSQSLPAALSQNASSFRKIIALAYPERKRLSLAVGLLFVSSAVSMSIPLTVGKIMDFFSNPVATIPYDLTLTQASVALFVVLTTGALANAGRIALMRSSGQRIIQRLRERTYAAALRQEPEFIERGEGDVISRLGMDTSIVGDSITQNLSDGLRSVVMASVGLGAMFYISPHLTFLTLTVVPPVSIGAFYYGRYIKRLSNQTQEALGDMTKVASEILPALRTVQAYNAHSREEQRFGEKVSVVARLASREARASAIFYGCTGWSGNMTLLGLLGYGSEYISVGELTSLLFYTFYVGSGLQMLSNIVENAQSSIMKGIGAGSRVFELLDREPVIPSQRGIVIPKTRSGSVRFEGIKFEYPTRRGVDVLKNFNMEIGVGESVAIVGKSGGGKSSIHALLLRYYDPTEGRITFDGQDIRDFNVSSWREMIGVVSQDPVMFSGTIAQNIAYGHDSATQVQIEDAARQANCDFVWALPHGFDTMIGRTSLSGGQRQRLAIARALLKKPKILALDEATSALDAASEHHVNNAIDRILRTKETTCLFVAHRLSTIARAERIVVLEDGCVTEMGSYRQLVLNTHSRFRELMSTQLHASNMENHKES
ncbi:P-loop containing nucleoside triphosphate hydrolase protein [Fistulina hepatica ATCC 64428]|nr:P-loop containing nucleoside triphosphate hydrolase protein [Fistulina hepatica ATCC 64428]